MGLKEAGGSMGPQGGMSGRTPWERMGCGGCMGAACACTRLQVRYSTALLLLVLLLLLQHRTSHPGLATLWGGPIAATPAAAISIPHWAQQPYPYPIGRSSPTYQSLALTHPGASALRFKTSCIILANSA